MFKKKFVKNFCGVIDECVLCASLPHEGPENVVSAQKTLTLK
jgi:hypothetical protein